ncbi:hypothetical protein [Actinomadura chibensis]|uniref:Uncharacterized protein n=1 Tax=Actinomadura chibensis TaxID=392828 RepID=A0A5D0NM04_9ACTN|nr:hypothetical protein [Actinomadura chibensis]TYB45526.1 hypothetical protein FXF69_19030 [Actinomadura chibensis]
MPDDADRLSALCRALELGELQEIAAEDGFEPLLDRIVAALADGAEAPAADLDALDARLVAYGVPGGLLPPTWRQYRPNPAATGAPAPAAELWACPTGRCARWTPRADGPPPTCAVSGEPLAERRLAP